MQHTAPKENTNIREVLYAKLRKATISFVMYVRMEQLDGFS
jgi:hypothetical protein